MRRLGIAVALVVLAAATACSSDDDAQAADDTTTTTTDAPPDTALPPPVRPAVEPTGELVPNTIRTADGFDRSYLLYVPSSLSADEPVPLLLAFHGGFGWGDQFRQTSRFDGLAEANGFLVAFLDGTSLPARPMSRVWNGGGCCGPAAEPANDVDDVAFVDAVIDQVADRFDVDPSRTYATGHSNGGIMSLRLACELADRIVGVGIQAGTLFVDSCDPAQPVSVFAIHGSADENLPIDGGEGPSSVAGVAFPPPLDGMATFARVDGCEDEPEVTTDSENPDITRRTWPGCDGGAQVVFDEVDGASHAWMGADARALSGEPYPDLDASLAIWTFLSAITRD